MALISPDNLAMRIRATTRILFLLRLNAYGCTGPRVPAFLFASSRRPVLLCTGWPAHINMGNVIFRINRANRLETKATIEILQMRLGREKKGVLRPVMPAVGNSLLHQPVTQIHPRQFFC